MDWGFGITHWDAKVMAFFNQFANAWPLGDRLIGLWANNALLIGGVLVGLFYWAWFSCPERSRERDILLANLLAAPPVTLIARLLVLFLPYRERPLHEPALHFVAPAGIGPHTFDGWSSFPSDHMVLLFGFATGIYMASRRIGLIAMVYTAIFVALPRIYAGYHWPSDILAGIAIGALLMWLAVHLVAGSFITNGINSWATRVPALFYACFFLGTFQVATLFNELRDLLVLGRHTV